MNGSQRMLAAIAICVVTAAAIAQNTPPVVTWTPSNAGSSTVAWNQDDNGWDVTLNRNSTLAPANVLVTSLTSEPIHFIKLNNGTDPWMTTLRVRGPSEFAPCGRVDSITAFDSGPAEIALLRMDGDLGGNLSGGDDAIQGFQNLGVVRITGDVLDTVNATIKITDCEVTGDVYGDFVALGTEQINGEAIERLVVKGTEQAPHYLYGSVQAPNGRIGTIEVQYGDIGIAQSPATIAAGVGENDRIQYINVPNGNIYADISTRDIEYADSGNEDAFYLYGNLLNTTITLTDAIRDNFTIEGGDFGADSSIFATAIGDQAKFKVLRDENTLTGGYLKGDITFTGNLSPQSPFTIDESLEGTLNIGLHLWDSVTINGMSSSGKGLVGQIIVNGTDTGGEWRSPVVVGSTTLSPTPYYNNKSVDLGGGAVGLVPYYCYYIDCTPRANKVDEDEDTGLDGFDPSGNGYHAFRKGVSGVPVDGPVIRHYGPITRVGAGKPFTVSARAFGGLAWTDITDIGSGFTITMSPGDDDHAYEIDGPFMPGYDYLIEPKVDNLQSDYLACDGIEATTVAIKDYDFVFRVFVLQDISMNGYLQPDDISAWLVEPEDTTLDGITDSADLVDVTEAVANSEDW